MKTYLLKLAGLIAVLGFLSACSASRIYHENLMAGQVVRAEDNQVVLCIGNEGGAEEGMTFNAYRVTYEGAITEDTDEYLRTFSGTVEITEIIDGHFARAQVVSGDVKRNDMVELNMK